MKPIKYALVVGFLTLSVNAIAVQLPVLVVGHKNPDTDAIVSAIAVAQLKSAQGIPAQAVAQGAPNPETGFVLEKFGFTAPPVQSVFAGRDVILVDHSDKQLAPDDIDHARLVGIYDHHKLGGLQTDEPIEVVIKPWGCTATIVYELFRQSDIEIDPGLAGLMLSAILSDTRVFRSPTTTKHDRKIAAELAQIAGITDMEAHGLRMLQAYNEEMVKLDDEALVSMDFKVFKMGSSRVGIAQLEAFDASFLMQRLGGLRQAMEKQQAKDALEAMVLAVTDVNRGGSTLLAVGPKADLAQSALGLSPDPLGTFKPDVLSRKRQIVPAIEQAFKHQ
jgi:manganese-dependent inorganic pyrophosphatase